jgi:hypothetical protein
MTYERSDQRDPFTLSRELSNTLFSELLPVRMGPPAECNLPTRENGCQGPKSSLASGEIQEILFDKGGRLAIARFLSEPCSEAQASASTNSVMLYK